MVSYPFQISFLGAYKWEILFGLPNFGERIQAMKWNSGEAVSCGLRGLFGLENTISSKVGKKGKRSNCPVEYEKISGTLVFLPWYSAEG